MTKNVFRRGSMRVVEGNYSNQQSPLARELIWNYFMPRNSIVTTGVVSQRFHLTAAGNTTVGLPANYTDASVLFMRIKTTGKLKVVVVSPTRGSRTIIISGTTAVPGYCQLQERITSITLTYIAATEVNYFAAMVPDLTVKTNIRGVTG